MPVRGFGFAFFAAWLFGFMAGGETLPGVAQGQQPPAEQAPAEQVPGRNGGQQVIGEQEVAARADDRDESDRADEIRQLVDGLRSDQFAIREECSERLFTLGHEALPLLKSTRRGGSDAEQNDRLDRIIHALSEQDLEMRIHSFLKGGDAELENWPEVKKWFGDSPRVRQLFVDLYREHPELVARLGGTPQQLSIGLSRVRRRLMERGVGPRETPQRVDLVALLLPMVEPNFQADPQYDVIVSSLLQYYPVNDFRNDEALGQPLMRLVTSWMGKSHLSVREQVLRLALKWELEIGLKLALDTITGNPDPILLCRCMQTLARQGKPEHARLLSRYLNDSTVVFRRRHRNLQGVYGSDVQVGDVAAASIAYLASVPVMEIGFAEPAEHEVFGIIYEELVVPMKLIESDSDEDGKEETEEEPKAAEPDDPRLRDPFPFGQRTPTWEQMQELNEQARRRDAMRKEIRAKALELVPKSDAPVEKS